MNTHKLTPLLQNQHTCGRKTFYKSHGGLNAQGCWDLGRNLSSLRQPCRTAVAHSCHPRQRGSQKRRVRGGQTPVSTAVPAEVPEPTKAARGPSVLPFARGDCRPASLGLSRSSQLTLGSAHEMCAQSNVLMGGLETSSVPLCSVPLTLEADL